MDGLADRAEGTIDFRADWIFEMMEPATSIHLERTSTSIDIPS